MPNSQEARARADANFKKKELKAQEGASAWADYQARRNAVLEKTLRLRALRLAKEVLLLRIPHSQPYIHPSYEAVSQSRLDARALRPSHAPRE